jgi:hypothetical protein
MSHHPLCGSLWLVGETIRRHQAHTAWLACGGQMKLWADLVDPSTPTDTTVRRVAIHHPAPAYAHQDAQEDILSLVRALLVLEGWSWRGTPEPRGLTTLTATDPGLNAHRLLPILGRLDGHMAGLGWTGVWTDALRDTLDNVAAFGALAADPIFDPSTFRSAHTA